MTEATVAGVTEALVGAAVLATLLGTGVVVLVRQARHADILAPVVWGLALRAGAMLIVHASSLLVGEGGLMFLDDKTYLWNGMEIAAQWRGGHIIDPGSYEYAGTPMFGYHVLCAAAFTLVNDILAGKLVNVLASASTVLVVGLIAGRIWGHSAKGRAAWAAALLPGLVWWSTPLMKETVACFLFTACLLAMLSLGRPWALPGLVAAFSALAVTRTAAAAALLVAAAPIGVWVFLRNRGDFQMSRVIVRIFTATGCAAVAIVLFSRGDVVGLVQSYAFTIDSMIGAYRESGVLHIPVSVVQSLISPYPWVFDAGTRNWDMGLYPGMWSWYAIYPLAAFALLRYGRRPEVVLLGAIVLVYLVINTFTSGYVFRQRSTIEPVILVLAVGGLTSWRFGAMVAAAAWGIVAMPAAAQSQDPITVIAILCVSGSAALLARRLPSAGLHVESPDAILSALRGAVSWRWNVRRNLRRLRALAHAAPSVPGASRDQREGRLPLLLALVHSAPSVPDDARPRRGWPLLTRVVAAAPPVTRRSSPAHGDPHRTDDGGTSDKQGSARALGAVLSRLASAARGSSGTRRRDSEP